VSEVTKRRRETTVCLSRSLPLPHCLTHSLPHSVIQLTQLSRLHSLTHSLTHCVRPSSHSLTHCPSILSLFLFIESFSSPTTVYCYHRLLVLHCIGVALQFAFCSFLSLKNGSVQVNVRSKVCTGSGRKRVGEAARRHNNNNTMSCVCRRQARSEAMMSCCH